ncbi:hypothetical protein [Rhodococcoides corynebacterioides]|uniref:hypothetical protein n=1 Tax=Rhodococcoides corynebacterioides TaxID=53972 RepID=UPI003530496D
MAARLAAELDAAAVVRRKARGARHRRVTVRPAPDVMAHLGALLPMDRAVCVWATLRRDADTLIATGAADGRTRDQIMADLLVERTTGLDHVTSPPVAVHVVISDEALLGGGDTRRGARVRSDPRRRSTGVDRRRRGLRRGRGDVAEALRPPHRRAAHGGGVRRSLFPHRPGPVDRPA